MNRDRLAAALLAPAIAFAFVVGALGLHRWYGIARASITLIAVIWIVSADVTRRDWLPGVSQRARGLLRLGATGLLGVEVGRIIVLMTKDGFAAGDFIALVIDLIVLGYLLQGALVVLGATPGQALYDAAVRAQTIDPSKALKLATRATKLYRRWDAAWILRAGMAGPEQITVLQQGLRYCPRSEDLNDLLISSLYAAGARDEADALLAQYRERFPRSARPVVIDAANAIEAGDWEAARTYLDEARSRARKARDAGALAKIEQVAALLPRG